MDDHSSTSSLAAARAAAVGKTMTETLDPPLYGIGFEIEEMSAKKVSGRLTVSEKNCQPVRVLHGGLSAFIAESLAGFGAHIASGFQRVAGIQLAINHVQAAHFGDVVLAEATPFSLGKTIQVWEVKLWKLDPLNSKFKTLVSSSRVTFLTNMTVPDSAKEVVELIKKHAKL